MKNPQQYKKGQLIGSNGLIFISEEETKNTMRYAKFQCVCGKIFETQIGQVKIGHTRSCGCLHIIMNKEIFTTHGMYKTHPYRIWDCIRERTANVNAKEYVNYGGRGIEMFPPWRYDFQLFYDYISALPYFGTKKFTLDRVNNDGNYEPGNLRWVNRHIQNTNTRMNSQNTSGYTGVCKHKGAWISQIDVMGRHIYIGRFKGREEALIARNNYIIANKLFEYKIQELKT